MDTVTYPNAGVISHLEERFVPVRLEVSANGSLTARYNVVWTPAFLCLDREDRVHARTFGYLPPEEFRPHLWLWEAKYHLDRARVDAALACLAQVTEKWAHSSSAPEAWYWAGVSHYKKGDREGLAQAWRQLRERYPESAWQVRASFLFDQ